MAGRAVSQRSSPGDHHRSETVPKIVPPRSDIQCDLVRLDRPPRGENLPVSGTLSHSVARGADGAAATVNRRVVSSIPDDRAAPRRLDRDLALKVLPGGTVRERAGSDWSSTKAEAWFQCGNKRGIDGWHVYLRSVFAAHYRGFIAVTLPPFRASLSTDLSFAPERDDLVAPDDHAFDRVLVDDPGLHEDLAQLRRVESRPTQNRVAVMIALRRHDSRPRTGFIPDPRFTGTPIAEASSRGSTALWWSEVATPAPTRTS